MTAMTDRPGLATARRAVAAFTAAALAAMAVFRAVSSSKTLTMLAPWFSRVPHSA